MRVLSVLGNYFLRAFSLKSPFSRSDMYKSPLPSIQTSLASWVKLQGANAYSRGNIVNEHGQRGGANLTRPKGNKINSIRFETTLFTDNYGKLKDFTDLNRVANPGRLSRRALHLKIRYIKFKPIT